MNWDDYPNFSRTELQCKYTKECNMNPTMMSILQKIRDDLGRPIFISSGFRSVKHPVEQEKDKPGEHTFGMAVDILCHSQRALDIINLALKNGIQRIGVHQKGAFGGRFVHIGVGNKFFLEFPVGVWTY